MEKNKVLLVVILVLNNLGGAEILRRSGAVGCSHVEDLCRYDEYCNEADFYPYGKCKRIDFKRSREHITGKRYSENGSVGKRNRVRYVKRDDDYSKYDITYFESDGSIKLNGDKNRGRNDDETYERRSGSDNLSLGLARGSLERRGLQNEGDARSNHAFENGKYDMTYYPVNDGSTVDSAAKNEVSSDRKLDRSVSRNNVDPLSKERNFDRTFKHSDDSWPPIANPLPIPGERKVEQKRTRSLHPIERRNLKTGDDQEEKARKTKRLNDESLDLDIEIKPLSKSDSKYLDADISKLSSIPERPREDTTTKRIEHVRTNIVSSSASKKTKVGVLVGGKLDEEKTNIVQNTSPDQTYDKVKDFFKSQQVSAIVDVPLTEKKKSVQLQSIPYNKMEEEGDVKRSSIPKPYFHPDSIRLDLKEKLNPDRTSHLLGALQDLVLKKDESDEDAFASVATDGNTVSFHLISNKANNGLKPAHVVEKINKDTSVKEGLKRTVGVTVLSASLDPKEGEKTKKDDKGDNDQKFMVTTVIVAACVSGVLLASVCIFIILRRTSQPRSGWVSKPAGEEAASDYQSLWRQLRQATWESPIQTSSVAHSDDSDSQKTVPGNKGLPPKYSWSEEPVDTRMDISTGHVVWSYMEDHLKNEDRLSKEWEELLVYEAEPDITDIGKEPKNNKKNRYSDVLPYDHNRVKLRDVSNATGSDYINASYIIDDDPRYPAYIATQGPLASTVADFWQMVWEQGVVVIVMLTKLADLGLPQCHRYWPQKGHELYHIYQVHLISEHIWCSDYLVRSFYLKNVQSGETRTVTQFHFLSWPHLGIPFSAKPLLDFRRKVLKCFRSNSSPVVVHCSGGIDRTGTYILIDMVLSKMSRGTKELDIAATLEHLRDQRPQMVKTKAQFEFALAAVAQEVNAILLALKH